MKDKPRVGSRVRLRGAEGAFYSSGMVISVVENRWLGDTVNVALDDRGPQGELLHAVWLVDSIEEAPNEEETE